MVFSVPVGKGRGAGYIDIGENVLCAISLLMRGDTDGHACVEHNNLGRPRVTGSQLSNVNM